MIIGICLSAHFFVNFRHTQTSSCLQVLEIYGTLTHYFCLFFVFLTLQSTMLITEIVNLNQLGNCFFLILNFISDHSFSLIESSKLRALELNGLSADLFVFPLIK